jgi:hypothetical protein
VPDCRPCARRQGPLSHRAASSILRLPARVDLRTQSCGFLNYRTTYTSSICEAIYEHAEDADPIDSRGDNTAGLYSPGVLPAAVDHDDDYPQLPAGAAASERWDVPLKVRADIAASYLT